MQKRLFVKVAVFLFSGFAFTAIAQPLVVPANISLPKDSIICQQLIYCINSFLIGKNRPDTKNEYVLQENVLETAALLDEMQGMEQNIKLGGKDFYKCYLSNAVKLNDNNDFLLQINYAGMVEGSPVLRASFNFLAKHINSRFYFYSPLKRNTASWKSKLLGHTTYYYKRVLNMADVKAYQRKVTEYNQKLHAPASPTKYYYCDDLTEALQLIGVNYKLDYNGMKNNNLTAHEADTSLVLNGWISENNRFDPHDLWHDRLQTVMGKEVVNRPVDEGCAYLYGGSWGLSFREVLTAFLKYAGNHPGADWKKLYISSENYTSGDKQLKIAYAINALIVADIEKKKGFQQVMQLLACGKRESGDANYFIMLQNITGVDTLGFNVYVDQLIKTQTHKI